MPEEDVLFEKRADGIGLITLNRPDSLNSLGGRVIPLLGQFLDEAEHDRAVRAVVLTGAGRGFCAGGDVRGMQARNDGQSTATSSAEADPVAKLIASMDRHTADLRHSQDITSLKLHTMPKPTIALVNGVAVDRALMPTKSGRHILVLGGDLRRQARITRPGEMVKVELWLDPEPDRIDLPQDLAATLDFLPDLKAGWEKIPPGMRRSICHWVRSGKTEATRAKRIAEILRRFETGHEWFTRSRKPEKHD
jgi:hypothetical protein